MISWHNILYIFIMESQREGTNKRLDRIILKLMGSSREPKDNQKTKGYVIIMT
jgi:hypothetical protein